MAESMGSTDWVTTNCGETCKLAGRGLLSESKGRCGGDCARSGGLNGVARLTGSDDSRLLQCTSFRHEYEPAARSLLHS
ncbi:protein of unknown function [Paraburkholderia dioscoreae]|uniref:Uncharacterized protein n=1 Tax=Paraburkholderia dioscoreae TaxID=2604047 RepID=A0A5Q4ZJM4_9BURK|nr:protein of unknown function [Paraburkholderia dioscoreae]